MGSIYARKFGSKTTSILKTVGTTNGNYSIQNGSYNLQAGATNCDSQYKDVSGFNEFMYATKDNDQISTTRNFYMIDKTNTALKVVVEYKYRPTGPTQLKSHAIGWYGPGLPCDVNKDDNVYYYRNIEIAKMVNPTWVRNCYPEMFHLNNPNLEFVFQIENTFEDKDMTLCRLKVTIYKGNTKQVIKIDPNESNPKYWNVFKWQDNTLTILNEYLDKNEINIFTGQPGTVIEEPNINYSNIEPEELEEMRYLWGYNEIKDNAKYVELYKRVYNCYKYRGIYPKYVVNLYGTGQKSPAIVALSNDNGLRLYCADLDLSWQLCNYVGNLVQEDFEKETNFKWGSVGISCDGDWQQENNKCNGLTYGEFTRSEIASHAQDIENALASIKTLVKQTYNIDFFEGTFAQKVKHYTELQKRQISKVIHDWIIMHSHYGDADNTDGINQIAWSALCNGKYDPICAGYARAYKLCCREFGIYSVNVIGHAGTGRDANHQWDMVRYDQVLPGENYWTTQSRWTEMDLTWDDPYDETRSLDDVVFWYYWNIPTNDLYYDDQGVQVRDRATWTWEYIFSPYMTYPVANCSNGTWKYPYNNSTEAGSQIYGGITS